MGTAKFTSISKQDLKEIRDFIAQDNPKTATKYMGILKQRCTMLADAPGLGVCREQYCGLHKFPVGSYLIFYRPSKTGIEVIRIIHGSRDIEAILNSSDGSSVV